MNKLEEFEKILPKVMKEKRRAEDWLHSYAFSANIFSDTHHFKKEQIDYFNECMSPIYSVEFFDENTISLTILKQKEILANFNPKEIYKHFSELFDDFCIGLSILDDGRFFWHKLTMSNRRFTKKIITSTGEEYSCSIDTYPQPVGFIDKKITFEKNFISTNLAFPMAMLWPILKNGKEWQSIYINYRKALLLLSLPQCDYSFYEEIFMLFYKSLENYITVDIKKKKKLSNEKQDILDVIQSLNNESYLEEFHRIYKKRSTIAAHGQRPEIDFITFEDVNDIKILLNSFLRKEILAHFVTEKSLLEIKKSPLR